MNELAVVEGGSQELASVVDTLLPAEVVRQVTLVQEVMSAVMRDGEHYGAIPGCGDKPTLLQPGAEKLAMTFRLAPTLVIAREDLANGHREYLVTCRLASITTGQHVGEGTGSCSTMESKYRYRNVSDFEVTGEPIPSDSKERKAEYRKQGYGMKKVDGVWEWVRFKDSGKVENPDIADVYNTVLKMAKKRAFIDAVNTTLAVSDIFTQDIEDLNANPVAPVIDAPASTTPAAPAEPETVKASTLKILHEVRDEFGVSPEKYAEQVKYYGASSDTELLEEKALALIDNYRIRIEAAKAAQAAEEPTVTIEDEEIPF